MKIDVINEVPVYLHPSDDERAALSLGCGVLVMTYFDGQPADPEDGQFNAATVDAIDAGEVVDGYDLQRDCFIGEHHFQRIVDAAVGLAVDQLR